MHKVGHIFLKAGHLLLDGIGLVCFALFITILGLAFVALLKFVDWLYGD